MDVSGLDSMSEVQDEVSLCAKAAGMTIDRALELASFARERRESLLEAMLARTDVDEGQFLHRLATLVGVPYLHREVEQVDDDVLDRISPAMAARYEVMPIEDAGGTLRVACWNPFDWQGWDEFAHIADQPLERILCSRSRIDEMIKANYGIGAAAVDHLVSAGGIEQASNVSSAATDLSAEDAANEPTVVNFVNRVLVEAINADATDIHFEPYDKKYRIRYRIDGMLEDVPIPPSLETLRYAIVSRVKIMSGLDITEKRLPQDGRAQVSLGGQTCDLRVSILPGVHGEGVVIRVQNRQTVKLDLGALGFREDERSAIGRLIARPHGLILVTGPTGSGKTTTLYTCLSNVRSPRTKIITIEDPVELWMDGMLQMQVHEDIGFTFARALRSMLRHDPDIMLVGEIRDNETAEIAIRSALTGHLVFATLHTNDAASAVARLGDIGIEPFLLASSLQGVLAQRLVRRVCLDCRKKITPEQLDDYGRAVLARAALGSETTLWRGEGCEACRFTGYRGRMVVGELLLVSAEIREMIQQREPASRIRALARRQGMTTLHESALLAVREEHTALAEVMRVTQEGMA